MNTSIRSLIIPIVTVINLSAVFADKVNPVPLEQEKIHAWYYAGKVDSASKAMERFRQKTPTYSRSDSLFIGKYLGVIYSMNPFDREKGRALFTGLLAMDSAASIQDLFAPPEVDSLFNALKPNTLPAAAQLAALSAPPVPPDSNFKGDSARSRQPAAIGNKSQRKKLFWIASGMAAATAVGVVTYYMVSAEPESQPPTTAVWDATNPEP